MSNIQFKNARAIAAQTVKSVIKYQQSLSDILPGILSDTTDDTALVHELTAGTLRWWWPLALQIDQLLERPFKSKDFDIYCLIVVGLYQIQHTRIPDHAAVSETVNSTKALGKPWSGKLVNAILRRYIREKEHLENQLKGELPFKFAHPNWMIKRLEQDWPDYWQDILNANNAQTPLTLRVNSQKTTVKDVLEKLVVQGIDVSETNDSPVGIKVNEKNKIWQSNIWKQGEISVQDESAQLSAYMTMLKPGMRVLDACAAPGGKTCHLLELEPNLNLLALDKDAERMERVTQNLARLNLNCRTKVVDAQDLDDWWDGELYDLILLDAPCSGSGVIGKHPDIKHLRHETDIDQNVQTQRRLLDKLWSVLKTGGSLLYCTCSVFRQENDKQAQWFMQEHSNAIQLILDDRFGFGVKFGRQRLPSQRVSGGFYYVGFEKNPS